ncbi:MAG: hypothetical protein ACFFD8_05610 [Candidatus Thorarchaeota archaeon]
MINDSLSGREKLRWTEISEETSSKEIKLPKRIWELLTQYIVLSGRYDEHWQTIHEQAQKRIVQYYLEHGSKSSSHILDTNELLEYINEFVDYLLIYYAYYRSTRRSMATLFASIGITDQHLFAEMVRSASDPRIKLDISNLDSQEINWFLKQFQEEYDVVIRHKEKMANYLPKLEFAVEQTYSEAMRRFRNVLQYAISPQAETLQQTGNIIISKAIAEDDLSQKTNLVVEAIEHFVANAQNHPEFILTESTGYFGVDELKEFDEKITGFKKVHELFKEHVSLSARTKWIYERHQMTLFTSIFDVSHLELMEFRDKIRAGERLQELESHIRDCQGMLLGVSQAYSLYLEYGAYSQQMLTLVDAYRQIADFLQSELLQILHTMELQKNNLYLEVRDEFRKTLNELQQALLKVCPLDTTNK